MSALVYVLLGVGAEYALAGMADVLRDAGAEVIEIDLATEPDPLTALGGAQGRRVVFITSAHLLLDHETHLRHYAHDGQIVSPLEIMGSLAPLVSVFYPHDLGEPLKDEELPYLSTFDLMLAPTTREHTFAHILPVEVVGWTRMKSALRPARGQVGAEGVALHVFSEFGYHQRLGVEETLRRWNPLWREGVRVRLPPWQGAAAFEQSLAQHGVAISPADGDLFTALDEADVVLTNSLSSVSTEAALAGRAVLNVLDGVYPEAEQRAAVGHLPGVRFADVTSAANTLRELRQEASPTWEVPATLRPFDGEATMRALHAAVVRAEGRAS